jgi:cyclopropane fatty-acyl-phospholipid synthase-like methyltransferase
MLDRNGFDHIVGIKTFQYIEPERWNDILTICRDMLKPDGRLFIQLLNPSLKAAAALAFPVCIVLAGISGARERSPPPLEL